MHDVKGDWLMCSWGDTLNAEREGHRLNPAECIRDAFIECKETYQLAGVLWRQERWLADLAKIDPRAYESNPEIYGTLHEVDDAEIATEGARQAGVKIYCYVDLYDEGQPPHVDSYNGEPFSWESKFFAAHPQYYACDRMWEK